MQPALIVPGCSQCPTHCCGQLPGVRPILMPWESPEDYAAEPQGPLWMLRCGVDGACVYFESRQCSIYHSRPFECRAYPLVLSFKPCPELVLDARAPCLDMVRLGEEYLLLQEMIDHCAFPSDWAAAHAAAEG